MPFVLSTPPDFTEDFPFPLSQAVAGSFGASADWDVSIGPLGYGVRISDATPYLRSTEAVRKQQFDTSREPGEQSLSSWWVRSQSSWDLGGGLRFYEPGTDEEASRRFGDSRGVYVWEPGQISLLHSTEASIAASSGVGHVAAADLGSDSGYVFVRGDSIFFEGALGDSSDVLEGTKATKPAVVGSRVYVGVEGGVDVWDGTAAPTGVVEAASSSSVCRVWYAKSRLIVAEANSLYWIPVAGGTLPGDGTLLFEHPDPSWTWTGVDEVGGAVLASGYSGTTSEIYRFTLFDDEGVPSLSPGSVTATLPHGEVVTAMGVYLGSVLVLGTSLGVRIGVVSDEGQVRYGPLTVELAEGPTDIDFRGTFAWVATVRDATAALLRVDLSAPIGESGRYAWAWDLEAAASGSASSVALVGDRVVLAAAGGSWVEGDGYVDEGWLDTGQIRFGTVENKAFRYLRLDAELNSGGVGVDAIDVAGTQHLVVRMGESFHTSQDIAIQIPGRLLNSSLTFVMLLSASDDNASSPVVSGLSVKATPAPQRVRLYRYPLSVFDREVNRWGNLSGYTGAAYERVCLLEALEETGAPVQIIDNRTGESYIGVIDLVEFTSTASPDGVDSGFGGVANVTIRRI